MASEIRTFKMDDIEEIIKLEDKFPPGSRYRLSKDEMFRLYKNNKDACLIAEDGGKIIGFVFGEVKDGCYFVKSAQVIIERIGEGVISKLLERVVKKTEAKTLMKG